jgi:hypothetical protein
MKRVMNVVDMEQMKNASETLTGNIPRRNGIWQT